MASNVLSRAHAALREEIFDPRNAEHLRAFVMLIHEGRQHPTLRFVLEHPYLDMPALMNSKITRAYIEDYRDKVMSAPVAV